MKKCFAILLIVLTRLLVLSLNSCHKPVTNQGEIVGDLQKSAVTMPPPAGMVLIPAGEFQMGSNDEEAEDDEQPVHTVHVDAFYMDKTEVTNAQYKAFLIANPYWQKSHVVARFHSGYYLQQANLPDGYYFQQVRGPEPEPPAPDYLHDWNGINYPTGKGNHPVTFVSWYAAVAYAEWAGKRLPTEAEWEYAVRSGLDGLYDMAGSVWEWCLDEYNEDFYGTFPRNGIARNPLSGADSVERLVNNFAHAMYSSPRVSRGGPYRNPARAVRMSISPQIPSSYHGFRCVKDVSP